MASEASVRAWFDSSHRADFERYKDRHNELTASRRDEHERDMAAVNNEFAQRSSALESRHDVPVDIKKLMKTLLSENRELRLQELDTKLAHDLAERKQEMEKKEREFWAPLLTRSESSARSGSVGLPSPAASVDSGSEAVEPPPPAGQPPRPVGKKAQVVVHLGGEMAKSTNSNVGAKPASQIIERPGSLGETVDEALTARTSQPPPPPPAAAKRKENPSEDAKGATISAAPLPKRLKIDGPSERTVTYNEVYQNGDAKRKHWIFEFKGEWYITKCEEHGLDFRLDGLRAAVKHINGRRHGYRVRDKNLAVQMLGYRVLDCTAERAKKHNDLVTEAFAKGHIPLGATGASALTPEQKADAKARKARKKAAQASTQPPRPPRAAPRSQQDKSEVQTSAPSMPSSLGQKPPVRKPSGIITNPTPGELYWAKYQPKSDEGPKRYIVMILAWKDLTRCGYPGVDLGSMQLLMDPKRKACYTYDPEGITGWARGYEDGGKDVKKRFFPAIWYEKVENMEDWVAAGDLQIYPDRPPIKPHDKTHPEMRALEQRRIGRKSQDDDLLEANDRKTPQSTVARDERKDENEDQGEEVKGADGTGESQDGDEDGYGDEDREGCDRTAGKKNTIFIDNPNDSDYEEESSPRDSISPESSDDDESQADCESGPTASSKEHPRSTRASNESEGASPLDEKSLGSPPPSTSSDILRKRFPEAAPRVLPENQLSPRAAQPKAAAEKSQERHQNSAVGQNILTAAQAEVMPPPRDRTKPNDSNLRTEGLARDAAQSIAAIIQRLGSMDPPRKKQNQDGGQDQQPRKEIPQAHRKEKAQTTVTSNRMMPPNILSHSHQALPVQPPLALGGTTYTNRDTAQSTGSVAPLPSSTASNPGTTTGLIPGPARPPPSSQVGQFSTSDSATSATPTLSPSGGSPFPRSSATPQSKKFELSRFQQDNRRWTWTPEAADNRLFLTVDEQTGMAVSPADSEVEVLVDLRRATQYQFNGSTQELTLYYDEGTRSEQVLEFRIVPGQSKLAAVRFLCRLRDFNKNITPVNAF